MNSPEVLVVEVALLVLGILVWLAPIHGAS